MEVTENKSSQATSRNIYMSQDEINHDLIKLTKTSPTERTMTLRPRIPKRPLTPLEEPFSPISMESNKTTKIHRPFSNHQNVTALLKQKDKRLRDIFFTNKDTVDLKRELLKLEKKSESQNLKAERLLKSVRKHRKLLKKTRGTSSQIDSLFSKESIDFHRIIKLAFQTLEAFIDKSQRELNCAKNECREALKNRNPFWEDKPAGEKTVFSGDLDHLREELRILSTKINSKERPRFEREGIKTVSAKNRSKLDEKRIKCPEVSSRDSESVLDEIGEIRKTERLGETPNGSTKLKSETISMRLNELKILLEGTRDHLEFLEEKIRFFDHVELTETEMDLAKQVESVYMAMAISSYHNEIMAKKVKCLKEGNFELNKQLEIERGKKREYKRRAKELEEKVVLAQRAQILSNANNISK